MGNTGELNQTLLLVLKGSERSLKLVVIKGKSLLVKKFLLIPSLEHGLNILQLTLKIVGFQNKKYLLNLQPQELLIHSQFWVLSILIKNHKIEVQRAKVLSILLQPQLWEECLINFVRKRTFHSLTLSEELNKSRFLKIKVPSMS